MSGALQKMVLVITSTKSHEVLERWTFDLQTDKTIVAGGYGLRLALWMLRITVDVRHSAKQ